MISHNFKNHKYFHSSNMLFIRYANLFKQPILFCKIAKKFNEKKSFAFKFFKYFAEFKSNLPHI